jgi:hypothetical protein
VGAALKQNKTLYDSSLAVSDVAQMLERIGASKHFRRAARLRGFLAYVCEETIAGRAEFINEQTVGNRVFGRPADYDPSSDNIVRVEARELRKRLEAYFADEGAADPVVVRIPKGRYAVVFEPRATMIPPVPAITSEALTLVPGDGLAGTTTQPIWFKFLVGALTTAVVALSLFSLYLYSRPEPPSRMMTTASATPLAVAFWAKMFEPQRPTLIALPDSNLSLLQDLRSESIPPEEYTSGRYLTSLRNPAKTGESARIFASIASRHYTGLGDVSAMARLMMLNQNLSPVVVRFARDLTIRDLKSQNVIFLGSPRSNPWVAFLLKDSRFLIEHDTKLGKPVLRDRAPEVSRPSLYFSGTAGEAPYAAYGLVVSVPNLDRDGRALVVAGTGTQGTEAAGEFLANVNRLEEFLRRIGWRENNALPEFELALKSFAVGGASMPSSIVAFRAGSATSR